MDRWQDISISDANLKAEFITRFFNGDYLSAFRIVEDNPQLNRKAFLENTLNEIANLLSLLQNNFQNNVIDFLATQLSNFNHLINEFKLRQEWDSQTTYEIYNFITRDDRLILNVTEWCKKEECWNRASNFGFELLDEFVDTLIDKDVLKQDEQDSKKDRKLENQLNADIEVIQLGQDYWKKVYNWGVEQKTLSQFESDLLKIASSFGDTGKIPSSKQCASILGIRNKLIADGMPKKFD